jgi:hypothetical protein
MVKTVWMERRVTPELKVLWVIPEPKDYLVKAELTE